MSQNTVQNKRNKPFYITFQDPNWKYNGLDNIINDVFNFLEELSGRTIPRRFFGNRWCRNPDKPYCTVDWYVRNSYDENGKVNAYKLVDNLIEEPWKRKAPHYDIMIIEEDMYIPGTNFIFGLTMAGNIVISNYRLKSFYGREWKIALLGLLFHEIGHFFGAPSPDNPNREYILGPHCGLKECMMEQINVPGKMDLLDKTKYVLRKNPLIYCEYDRDIIVKNIRKLYY